MFSNNLSHFILDDRLELDLPELGSVTLGVTDLRSEEEIVQMSEDVVSHDFHFRCLCEKCSISDNEEDRTSSE